MAAVEKEVREGFICPICLKDCCTVDQLQEHFDIAHFTQDKGSHNILSLLSKAKNKFLQNDQGESPISSSLFSSDTVSPHSHKSYASYENPFESQAFGFSRNLTGDFRKLRHSQMTRTAVEMNRLIIRLEKLTDPTAPTEPAKRKAYEQQIVPWVEDKLVKNCPSCGAKFGVSLNPILLGGDLLLRKHHCRLCGYMICSDCSYMLPSTEAKRLLHLVQNLQKIASYDDDDSKFDSVDVVGGCEDSDDVTKSTHPYDRGGTDCPSQLTFVQRADSFSSLNQFLPTGLSEQKDYELRCCEVCKGIMDLKFKRIEEKSVTPRFMRLYDKLRREMHEIDKLLPVYEEMIQCIFEGKTTYSLTIVNDRRNELKMKFEKIAMLGKQLEDFGKLSVSPDDPDSHPRQSLLLSSINKYAKRYVLERMAPLRSLPRPDEYEARVAQRAERLRKEHEQEERILRQKQSAEFSKMKKEIVHRREPARPHTDSWIPENQSSASLVGMQIMAATDGEQCDNNGSIDGPPLDPLLEALELQIVNVNGYLAQALDANRQNEVTMLQKNLKELRIAYEQRRVELGIKSTYSNHRC